MERRAFLGTIGIALTTAAAGCISRASSGDGSETETETEEPTTTEPVPEVTQVASDTVDERTLGDGTLSESGLRKPHHVELTNPTDETWETRFVIRRADAVALEVRFELGSNASVRVALTDLDTYELEATVRSTEETETVDIGYEQFDCNNSRTSFAIQEDGTLESATISTLMACMGVVTEQVGAGDSTSMTLGDEPVPQDTGRGIHTLLVRNPTEETWTTRLLVGNESRPLLDGVYTLEADSTVLITFSEAAEYQVETAVLETGASEQAAIGPEYFDCNSSSTRAVLDADGGVKLTTISTLMACPDETANETADDSE